MLVLGRAPIERWAAWLNQVYERCVPLNTPALHLRDRIKSFILHWTLFTNSLEREFTLMSAQTFGSFHLLRSWMDEYMMFKAERKCLGRK